MFGGVQMSGAGERMCKGFENSSSETHRSDHDIYVECLTLQTLEAAIEAIGTYNFTGWTKESVDYKIDQLLISNGFQCMGKDVVHVNFTAKKDDGGSASGIIQHFFGELIYNEGRMRGFWTVCDCVTFDPADATNPEKISKSCDRCSEEFGILHPVGHCMYGLYDEDHYIDFNNVIIDKGKDDGAPRPEPLTVSDAGVENWKKRDRMPENRVLEYIKTDLVSMAVSDADVPGNHVLKYRKKDPASMTVSDDDVPGRHVLKCIKKDPIYYDVRSPHLRGPHLQVEKELIGNPKTKLKGIIPSFDKRSNRPIVTRPTLMTLDEADTENREKEGRALGNDALKFLKEMNQDLNYEYISFTSMCSCIERESGRVIRHGNFFARKVGERSEYRDLFFVEALVKSDGIGLEVLNCSQVKDGTVIVEGCLCCVRDYGLMDHLYGSHLPVFHPVGLFTYGTSGSSEEGETGQDPN